MERRLRTRKAVELPMAVLAVDGEEVQWPGTTRNISTGGGVCFTSAHRFNSGQRIQYVVTLSPGAAPIRIGCSGLVVRCTPETDAFKGFYETAVTMERYRFIPGTEDSPIP